MTNSCLTIPEMVRRQAAVQGDQIAFVYPDVGSSRWLERTWREWATDIAAYYQQLQAWIQPGERVVSLVENRYAWPVFDLAIQLAGGVHVPLHPQLTRPQVLELVDHCGARVAIGSSREQLAKLPADEGLKRFTLDPGDATGTFLSLVDPNDSANPDWQALPWDLVQPDQLVSILYTSGTTGQPKGVMLTQHNVVANSLAKVQTLPLSSSDVRLCWLPLTHIFARVCDLYTAYLTGCRTVLSRGREYLFDELQQFSPTYLNAVPFFYERCYRKLKSAGTCTAHDLQTLLGGRMQVCNCGGAPLADEIFDFFRDRGLPLVTGYGLTETAPVLTSNRLDAHRRGSVGQAIPGVALNIAEDGEVLAAGPNVMRGYYRDPEGTKAVLRDGWFHTGDLGYLDKDGFLFLTGRKKDLLVTTGGKKIAPVTIENRLLADPVFEQVMVIGDGQDYLTALIVPHHAELARHGLASQPPEEGEFSRETYAWMEGRIGELLKDLSKYEQIRRFLLLARPFQLADGTTTAKGSLRRHIIEARYAEEIRRMYTATPENHPEPVEKEPRRTR